MKVKTIIDGLSFAKEVALELLWPTRCAVCDSADENVLCDECRKNLIPIDRALACPKCGAPFGILECTECNGMMLEGMGLEELPFDNMHSAFLLDDATRSIVIIYKDHNERRLVDFISSSIALQISPETIRDDFIVSYIPDSREAYRRRGFDHAQELAEAVCSHLGLKCARLFDPPRSLDQRKLGRRSRIQNMKSALHVKNDVDVPAKVLLVDDVCTTGATMYAACLALKERGADKVEAVTFGRVLG